MTTQSGAVREPSGEPLPGGAIERYLRARGRRFFRGQHDGEYFFVTDEAGLRLHVHLEISPARSDVFTVRVTPAHFFPGADRDRLVRFVESWNLKGRDVAGIVHGSSDPRRVGVEAVRSQWVEEALDFESFAGLMDRALGSAIEFFGAVAGVVSQPLLRDAG